MNNQQTPISSPSVKTQPSENSLSVQPTTPNNINSNASFQTAHNNISSSNLNLILNGSFNQQSSASFKIQPQQLSQNVQPPQQNPVQSISQNQQNVHAISTENVNTSYTSDTNGPNRLQYTNIQSAK